MAGGGAAAGLAGGAALAGGSVAPTRRRALPPPPPVAAARAHTCALITRLVRLLGQLLVAQARLAAAQGIVLQENRHQAVRVGPAAQQHAPLALAHDAGGATVALREGGMERAGKHTTGSCSAALSMHGQRSQRRSIALLAALLPQRPCRCTALLVFLVIALLACTAAGCGIEGRRRNDACKQSVSIGGVVGCRTVVQRVRSK